MSDAADPEEEGSHSNGELDPAASALVSMRQRFGSYSARAETLMGEHRERRPLVDLGFTLYERDRDAFASVLGSAIALRLFLFTIPAITSFVGLVNVFAAPSVITSMLDASGTAGKIAVDIENATQKSHTTGWVLLGSSLVLLFFAGRSLTRVLAASAAAGWSLVATQAKPTLRMAGTLTGLFTTIILVTVALGRVRRIGGVALTTGSFVMLAVVIAFAWFAVLWSLPSATPDPGAQLPGAAFLGTTFALLQWFMQFYLPARISKSSDTFGSIGFSVATLGYFFFIGRIMASSFVVNGVVFERYGSLSEAVFELPGLRRLPAKYPKLRTFFGLDEMASGHSETGA